MLPSYKLGAQRRSFVAQQLKLHGLSPWHAVVVRLHNFWQPYHNYQHLFGVGLFSLQLAAAEGLSQEACKKLLLAALYHDYAHTGRKQSSDQVNIDRALQGVQFWLPKLEKNGLALLADVKDLISSTDNAYVSQPTSIIDSVLRDADLLASVDSDKSSWYIGLGKESGRESNDASTTAFFTHRGFYTNAGQALFEEYLANGFVVLRLS